MPLHPERSELRVKLLLDEMYTGLKEYLQALGWDVVTVHDANLAGASDRKIVEYAERNGLLLVTQDEKHADLASLRHVPCVLISKTMLTKMIDAELRKTQTSGVAEIKMKPSRIFDPAHIAVLESEDRKMWQNPDEILAGVELRPNWVAVDLGCGSGYFTVPLSNKVKRVLAIDVQKEMLDFLKNKIRQLKIKNIKLLLSQPNEIPVGDNSVDFLMSVNALHEFDARDKMTEEMRRVLKKGGKLLVVDFKKEDTGFGPPVSIRVSKERAVRVFEKRGFRLSKTKDLPYHYVLVFVKA